MPKEERLCSFLRRRSPLRFPTLETPTSAQHESTIIKDRTLRANVRTARGPDVFYSVFQLLMDKAVQPFRLLNATLILPDRLIPGGALDVEGGRLTAVGRTEDLPRWSGATLDANGDFVAPGFVDLHVHGGDNADFMRSASSSPRVRFAGSLLVNGNGQNKKEHRPLIAMPMRSAALRISWNSRVPAFGERSDSRS